MKETQLISTLLPGHPDLVPIVQKVLKDHGFDDFMPGEETLAEFLGAEDEPDLFVIRQELDTLIRNSPELLPQELAKVINFLKVKDNNSLDIPELAELPEETRQMVKSLLLAVLNTLEPIRGAVENYYQILTENLFAYLLTGELREIPENWIGAVYTMSILGNPVVVAMASQAADPKEISDQFKAEYHRIFGKDRPNLTDGNLNSADYLRMKLTGMSISDIVDVYILRHPDQFPKDPGSKAYREAKRKHEEMMKKRLQRLQNTIDKLLGDKN